MSPSVNKVILVGRLGGTPELKYTARSKPVATFGLALNETWKDSEGNRQERVEWVRIVGFGRLAKVCGEYLSKGRHVCVEGRLQIRNWEDRNGDKRTTVEVVASEMRRSLGEAR